MQHTYSLLWLLFLPTLSLCAQPEVLKMSETSQCIKEVVALFVNSNECKQLSDSLKMKLALRMTACLMTQMGKEFPQECLSQDNCKLSGDGWNTFSTFYAHIDNLCHFYWEMLHHQKAEALIDKLMKSSSTAEQILQRNAEETKKMLQMQEAIAGKMQTTYESQLGLEKAIYHSEASLLNYTTSLSTFLKNLQGEIDSNYRALQSVLAVINVGVENIFTLQGVLLSDISSLQGLLYYCGLTVLALISTSFPSNYPHRSHFLAVIGFSFMAEVFLGWIISHSIGYTIIRGGALLHMVSRLAQAREDSIASAQLKKALKSAMKEHKMYRFSGKVSPPTLDL